MQQAERDRGGEGPEDIKQQHQDRRLKPTQAENQPQPQPQKCPRCESLNTKFCYYNNYSLSQPRFFCKTCRRYWTQGGTLRNVPVGGGCRKGKRAKTSSSSTENSRSHQHPQQNPVIITTSQAPRTKEPAGNLASPSAAAIPSLITQPYYQGGGYLSSLAAIQSLNQSQSSFSQARHVGGDLELGGSSNLGVLQGFSVPTFRSQHHQQQRQIHQQTQFYQMGSRETFYPNEETMNYSTRPTSNSSHHDWPHSFISNTNPRAASDHATLWSISTPTTTTNNAAGSSLNPNQWPNLPGYGPPP